MPMEKWDVCYGGLDLSSTTDLTAFALVFPPVDEEDKYIVLPYFWVSEETLDLRVKRDHVPYDVWERKGFQETTEGNVVHYAYIENFIERRVRGFTSGRSHITGGERRSYCRIWKECDSRWFLLVRDSGICHAVQASDGTGVGKTVFSWRTFGTSVDDR